MVSHAAALDQLRDDIVRRGGGFLRNTTWEPGVTCSVCTGIPAPGATRCGKCATFASTADVADALGFVTYAWQEAQSGQTMYRYKWRTPTNYQLVKSLFTYAAAAHWDCIAERVGSHPDGWASVPSLAGREGTHPIEAIAASFMSGIHHVSLTTGSGGDNQRGFDPRHFTATPTDARHVLLLDDTWTTGGHLQSAAAALKSAGVQTVTGLVVARWLNTSWANTQQFVDGLSGPFDPAICPYTGRRC